MVDVAAICALRGLLLLVAFIIMYILSVFVSFIIYTIRRVCVIYIIFIYPARCDTRLLKLFSSYFPLVLSFVVFHSLLVLVELFLGLLERATTFSFAQAHRLRPRSIVSFISHVQDGSYDGLVR